MPLLRSFIAIAGGFACMAVLTGTTTLLTCWLVPSWSRTPPSRSAQVFNLVASCLFAVLGGHLTALLAPVSPLVHSLILAAIVLLMSTIAANELRGHALGFYPLALAVLPSMATLGGGILTVLYR
jgi:Na+/citrate or Na+/malate symporter